MKNLLFLAFSIALFTSCVTTQYYQVCSTKSANSTTDKGNIVFEDENCKVSYDLWTDHGNSGFFIFNKSDNDIVIDLTKSFFVMNQYSRSYYLDQALDVAPNNNFLHPERTVPPQTMIKISEFQIFDTRFTHCDLNDKPGNKENAVLKFDETTSPAVFYNLITYEKNSEIKRLETKFYVNEITNIPGTKMFRSTYEDECGRRLSTATKVYALYAPDKFYIDYFFYSK